MSESAKLKLTLNECGYGTVSLNGLDIGNYTTCIEFKAKVGNLTEVKLTIWAEVDAEVTATLESIALFKEKQPEPEGMRLLDGRIVKTRPARA